jgi:hypothetical protein
MTTEYNNDTNTLTLGGISFTLSEDLTLEQIRENIANIQIGTQKIGDFYNPSSHTFVNVASVSDEQEAQQRVDTLQKLLSDVKKVSQEAVNVVVKDETDEKVFLKLVEVTTVATKIIAGVMIIQNVGSQLCAIGNKNVSSPNLKVLDKQISDLRALLEKTTRLLFSMESIPQN